MTEVDERDIDPIKEMTRIAQHVLELHLRGFRETYRSTREAEIIFDSEWCRINFIWGGWDYATGNNMQIRYGRLHALNNQTTMIWQGEECRCWHRGEYMLHLLDGRTPADAAEIGYSHSLTRPFYKEELRKNFDRRQPEWLAEMQLKIWQQYGQPLFDIFDVRKPDLWEQYRKFLKDVYDVEGRDADTEPSMDKVC